MRRYLPVVVALCIVGIAGWVVVRQKQGSVAVVSPEKTGYSLGTFGRQRSCARLPRFLLKRKIPQPVVIDLSQKRFKGIALLYGKRLNRVIHPKIWERYGHFGTYALNEQGDIYLAPMPFISITPATFNLQKNIYKVDSATGKISILMHLEDVLPTANNPYGIDALTYDCEDRTLWAAAIDESDYSSQKGTIYHLNPRDKTLLQKSAGMDVLSMALLRSQQGKYLLVGSARDNALYAYTITNSQLQSPPVKLLELPNPNEHIRKIKVLSNNTLELQTIPFSYALIAQTDKNDRHHYHALWDEKSQQWRVEKM